MNEKVILIVADLDIGRISSFVNKVQLSVKLVGILICNVVGLFKCTFSVQ